MRKEDTQKAESGEWMTTSTGTTNKRHTAMRTLDDVDVAGKRVLVRVDFNVPFDEQGHITDDSRIVGSLPTIQELQRKGAKIILISHRGRPKGSDPELSMRPAAQRLGELLKTEVQFVPAVTGDQVAASVASSNPGDVLVLENLRFEAGETKNDPELARSLGQLADVYVNDAFGAAHRAHASTEGVVRHVPVAVAGRLLQREVTILHSLLEDPARPLVVILGGAKVTDKIGVIEAFLNQADTLLIGGAMSFPFLKAQGFEVGDSLCEAAGVTLAQQALAAAGGKLELPGDHIAADRFAADARVKELNDANVPGGWMGLDIGPATAARYVSVIEQAGTIFWNGPMGAFELQPFAAGTRTVAEAIANAEATTVVGGGDSVAALKLFGLVDQVDHLSTGGGAALELIEGKALPGVEALR